MNKKLNVIGICLIAGSIALVIFVFSNLKTITTNEQKDISVSEQQTIESTEPITESTTTEESTTEQDIPQEKDIKVDNDNIKIIKTDENSDYIFIYIYTTETGDTLQSIADKFSVNATVIHSLNDYGPLITENYVFKPGDQVFIPFSEVNPDVKGRH